MTQNCKLFLFLVVNFLTIETYADSVWAENFSVSGKGFWGDDDGTTIHSDLSGIDQWTLNTDSCRFSAADDYVMTVETSGGRLEVRDCDGEAVWMSRWIPIGNERNVSCDLIAKETGSGTDPKKKYVRVYYQLDQQPEMLFEVNGANEGNWGESIVSQTGLEGDSLRIIVRFNSGYASDKVIVDEIRVTSEQTVVPAENLAAKGDLLFSEVLFDPYPDGAEFVELCNVSGKSIRLDHVFLSKRDETGQIQKIYQLSEEAELFHSNNYLLITKDTAGVRLFYADACTGNFLETDQFPALKNDGDNLVLLNDSMEIIDEVIYSPAMHHDLLANRKGVSLERISFETETLAPGNWTSATSASGFATPGYPNSQLLQKDIELNDFSVEPSAFSPNQDGYNDLLTIHYSLARSGYIANVKVFDSRGSFVCNLVNNETCGQTGDWTWDGRMNDNRKARIGIYIIYIELTDMEGHYEQYKKSCTIADRFM